MCVYVCVCVVCVLPTIMCLSTTKKVFIDFNFKKAFNRVLHAALWATMKKYNISANLIQVIRQLYDKAASAVLFSGSIRDWFRTTVGAQQGCLLSSTLFKTCFLKGP